jgi:hypothetical protein
VFQAGIFIINQAGSISLFLKTAKQAALCPVSLFIKSKNQAALCPVSLFINPAHQIRIILI